MIIRSTNDYVFPARSLESFHLEKNGTTTRLIATSTSEKRFTLGTWKVDGVAKEALMFILENWRDNYAESGILDIKKTYPEDKKEFNKEHLKENMDVIIHKSEG